MKINKLKTLLIISLVSILFTSCTTSSKIKGKTSQIIDADGNILPNSIAEILRVKIGDINQHLIIRGADTTKPVMLYLHGGPGDAETVFMREFNPALENDFIMVYWEQRGAGKSYSKHIPPESMNVEQFISDTKEVSEYLIKKFNKNKIYIMGHSWGAFLGILTAYRYPELYYAYFGIGQACMQYESEKISLDWITEQAKLQNDKKSIKKISKLNLPEETASGEEWVNYLMRQRKFVRKYGGGPISYTEITKISSIVKIVLNAEEYSFSEKLGFAKASSFSCKHLFSSIIEIDVCIK